VIGAECAQLALAALDLAVELVDQAQARLQRPAPDVRELQALEQGPAAGAEEVGDGAGNAVREQRRVHAVLEARPVADEVEAEAGPLAFGPHGRAGQPHRRHELPPAQLGKDASVDAVGLAGERRQPSHAGGVGDVDVPAGELELIVDEAGAVHRLDRRPHLRAGEAAGKGDDTVSVRRRGVDGDGAAALIERVKVETATAEIQTDVQHCDGPPLG
jgi:hypothetical protein